VNVKSEEIQEGSVGGHPRGDYYPGDEKNQRQV